MPAIHHLQLDPEDRPAWVNYSALDAKATWELHAALRVALRRKKACEKRRAAPLPLAAVAAAGLMPMLTLRRAALRTRCMPPG
jgi:hypothetical protein